MISRTASIGWCSATVLIPLFTAIVAMARTKGASDAREWGQFLGPTRNGMSTERNLLDQWPAGGVKEVWRAAGGVGMSGIAVSRGRAITLFQKEGQQFVAAYDSRLGKSIWQTPLALEYKNAQGDGPRATPTISGDSVSVFTGDGVLASVNFSDGRLLWSQNVVKDLGGEVAEYGMASSPLIVDQLVVVTAGAPQACSLWPTIESRAKSSGKPAMVRRDTLRRHCSKLAVGGRSLPLLATRSLVYLQKPGVSCGATRIPRITTAIPPRQLQLTAKYSFHQAKIMAASS